MLNTPGCGAQVSLPQLGLPWSMSVMKTSVVTGVGPSTKFVTYRNDAFNCFFQCARQ